MPLAPGTRLGPYEITAVLGAGGMGQVFRARDERLGREVAIKVLPTSFAADADRLQRFETEAKAAGQLNHPNVLTVFDVGTHDGAPYLVTELLEGDTLRDRLSAGALPLRKALDTGVQIAQGLAAAHDCGIVHRDLKPENIFVTRDGRVKVLDFGLARITAPADTTDSTAETTMRATNPGTVLGTVGYMSPEQVRGAAVDPRTDIFSCGAVLYEMLSGRRAFHGESGIETMNAILKEDPPELVESGAHLPPAVDRIVRRCLEKRPEERFHSAHDLGFALEAVSGLSTTQGVAAAVDLARPARRPSWALVAAGLLAIGAAAFVGGRVFGTPAPVLAPEYHRLTFRRGLATSARLAPDGHTILYSAAWDGGAQQLYSTRLESPESQPLPFGEANVAAISKQGELALLSKQRTLRGWVRLGTLSRAPLSGGAARAVLDDVQEADWLPDGSNLVVSRWAGDRFRLEFPIGTLVYETNGFIGDPRVSPDGQRVAFLDHPVFGDDRGSLAFVDRQGKLTRVPGDYDSVQGVAWVPSGKEVWFTAAEAGTNRRLYAASLDGKRRLILSIPGNLQLGDIGADGSVLLAQHNARLGSMGQMAGDVRPHDLSWFDWSQARALSDDGKMLLIGEEGDGGGPGYSTYLRGTDGSSAIRLGTGEAQALSPDGKWALVQRLTPAPPQLVLEPTGAGQVREVTHDNLTHLQAGFLPDGKRIVFVGFPPGGHPRTYLQDLAGGAPKPITAEGVNGLHVSPNGADLLVSGLDGVRMLQPIDGGPARPVPGMSQGDSTIRFTPDGRGLYVREHGAPDTPVRIVRVDLATGARTFVREVPQFIAAGNSGGIGSILLTADAKGYVAGYTVTLSDLYLVKGLH